MPLPVRVIVVPSFSERSVVLVTNSSGAVPGWIGSALSYGGYGLAIAIYMTFLVAAYEDDSGFGTGHASGVFALAGVCIAAGGVLNHAGPRSVM